MGTRRSNQYTLPPGYAANVYLISAPGLSLSYYGARYNSRAFQARYGAYGVPSPSNQRQRLTFSAAPADLAQITLRDNANAAVTFQFVYAGSTPTGGIVVPLIASGGTAAQAAAAIVAAYNNVTKVPAPAYYAEVPLATPTIAQFLNRTPGKINSSFTVVTGITTTSFAPSMSYVLPGICGGMGCFMPGQTNS